MTDPEGHKSVRPPWTLEQVGTLERFQTGGWFHPFTCGRRHQHDGEGVLIPTTDGFECPDPSCTFTQTWCHDFMVDKEWVLEAEGFFRRGFGSVQDGAHDG